MELTCKFKNLFNLNFLKNFSHFKKLEFDL